MRQREILAVRNRAALALWTVRPRVGWRGAEKLLPHEEARRRARQFEILVLDVPRSHKGNEGLRPAGLGAQGGPAGGRSQRSGNKRRLR